MRTTFGVGGETYLWMGLVGPLSVRWPRASKQNHPSKLVRSPLPGRIVAVSVKVLDDVTAGTEVYVLETMEMEQSIRVSQRGTVRAVLIKTGQNVSVGEPLIQLD